jgi:hypothetical protein
MGAAGIAAAVPLLAKSAAASEEIMSVGSVCLRNCWAFPSGFPPRLRCRRFGRQRVEAGLIGGFPIKRRVGPPAVVESEVSSDQCPGFQDVGAGPHLEFLVFDGPLKALYKTLLHEAPLPSVTGR